MNDTPSFYVRVMRIISVGMSEAWMSSNSECIPWSWWYMLFHEETFSNRQKSRLNVKVKTYENFVISLFLSWILLFVMSFTLWIARSYVAKLSNRRRKNILIGAKEHAFLVSESLLRVRKSWLRMPFNSTGPNADHDLRSFELPRSETEASRNDDEMFISKCTDSLSKDTQEKADL